MEPSGSPISTKANWMLQIQSVGTALNKLQKIEELVQFSYGVTSIKTLKEELGSLSHFFNFLTETKNVVLSPELGYFCVLPPEVIYLVIQNLVPLELCRMACVNKYFRDLGDEESVWQNMFQTLNLDRCGDEYLPKTKGWKWLVQSKLNVFKEGEHKNGVGMYIWPCKISVPPNNKHENRYCGEWKDDRRDGFGTYYWCNGSLYAGEWKNDKREGFGTRTWPNGNKYVGEYKNHKRHGEGGFTFSNGSIFKGTFEDNKFVRGTYTWPNKRVYNGDWNNIFRHGKGSYWWPDGRTYDGEWKGDKRHGNGKYTWPDGDCYEGPFCEGKRVGKGTFTKASTGQKISQDWNEDKFEEYNKGLIDEKQTEKNKDEENKNDRDDDKEDKDRDRNRDGDGDDDDGDGVEKQESDKENENKVGREKRRSSSSSSKGKSQEKSKGKSESNSNSNSNSSCKNKKKRSHKSSNNDGDDDHSTKQPKLSD